MEREATGPLDALDEYLDALPESLGIWRTTPRTEHYPLLAWINTWPVEEVRNTAAETGQPLLAHMLHNAEHFNATGLAVRWANLHMSPSVPSQSGEMERRGLMKRATTYWWLRDLVSRARGGAYAVSAEGDRVRFDFAADPAAEALDGLLDLVRDLQEAEELRLQLGSLSTSPQILRRHVQETNAEQPWESLDLDIRDGFRAFGSTLVDGMRRVSAPDDLTIKGFTLGEALAAWKELLAVSLYRQLCLMFGAVNPLVTSPPRAPEELVNDLAPSGIDPSALQAIVEFLTMGITGDPCLTPIIHTDSGLVAMSSLVTPASPERNILAKLKEDPSSFGTAGSHIGKVGTKAVAEVLRRIPAIQVATEVSVRSSAGETLGDLDVVAVDESDRLVAVFEVKWQLDPDGSIEIDKAEGQAEKGQDQIRRLRPHVEGGHARIRWPDRWPTLEGFEWRWFVITSNVIPVARIGDDDVPARSHKVLAMMAMRKDAPLREVCDTYSDPAMPVEGEQFLMETNTRSVGRFEIVLTGPT